MESADNAAALLQGAVQAAIARAAAAKACPTRACKCTVCGNGLPIRLRPGYEMGMSQTLGGHSTLCSAVQCELLPASALHQTSPTSSSRAGCWRSQDEVLLAVAARKVQPPSAVQCDVVPAQNLWPLQAMGGACGWIACNWRLR